MGETKRTRDLCRECERVGADCFPVVAGRMSRPGYPDRVITTLGHVFWVEFKDENTRLRPDQRLVLKRLRARAPGRAWVVRFMDGGDWLQLENEDGEVHATCACEPREFLRRLKGLSP